MRHRSNTAVQSDPAEGICLEFAVLKLCLSSGNDVTRAVETLAGIEKALDDNALRCNPSEYHTLLLWGATTQHLANNEKEKARYMKNLRTVHGGHTDEFMEADREVRNLIAVMGQSAA